MKRHLLNWIFWRLIICSGLLSSVCSSLAQAQPALTSFSPANGPIGTTVTIVGTGFNTTLANNVVFFGATRATVKSVASTTSLVVTVPAGANYEYISVTNLGTNLMAYSAIPFVVTYSPMGDNSFRPKSVYTSGNPFGNPSLARDVVIADVNRDGKPDLVVANSDRTICIFPNQTTSITAVARFGPAITLGMSVGCITSAAVVNDFDGDGMLDIATMYAGCSSVQVYRNSTYIAGGTPSFNTSYVFTTGFNPSIIGAGDLDNNGKTDLIAASTAASENVFVLRNTSIPGTIMFAPYQTFSAGTRPSGIVVGDLDKDGKVDIAVSNRDFNNVFIFKNKSSIGHIRLKAQRPLTTGTHASSIAIADFDGDNQLDLAVVNSLNTASVFLNTSSVGTIHFAPKVDFSVSSGSLLRGIAIGDTDGDGKPDMVITSPINNAVPVLRNASTIGALSFTTSTSLSSTLPFSVAVGDLNADGRLDVVIANSTTSNNVSVFLQRSAPSSSIIITSANTMPTYGALTATVTTVGASGPVLFEVNAGSGSATVNASTGLIKAVAAGTITLSATIPGATTSQLITIYKITPTLTITSASTMNVDSVLTATVSSTVASGQGGAITFGIAAGSGSATVNSRTGLIRAIGAGTVILIAKSAGDSNYLAASTSRVITIGKTTPTLMITSNNVTLVDGVLMTTISTTASHNIGVLSYIITNSSAGSAIVNVDTGLIYALSAGTVILKVTSAGNADYASVSASQLITIGQSTPTLTITSANSLVVDATLTATVNTTATYGRGGSIIFAISSGSGSATVDPNTGLIGAISAGTITLSAVSAGDADYYGAITSQLITIKPHVLMSASLPDSISEGKDPSLTKNPNMAIPDDGISTNIDSGELANQGIIVPKAFSPNGDGLDDSFDMQNILKYPENELVVANMSGEAVFKAHGYNNETVIFAGKSDTGAELVEGLYYYTLILNNHDKLSRHVGYFKLKR